MQWNNDICEQMEDLYWERR